MAAALVLCTAPSAAAARKMAVHLIRKKLAACVSLQPHALSVYRWKGKIEKSAETQLLIKTSGAKYAALEKEIKKHHPYEIPEILSVRVARGSRKYLSWLDKCLK